MHDCMPNIFMWFLEIELRTSCLHGKHFRVWTISLVFCFECSTYVQASLRKSLLKRSIHHSVIHNSARLKTNASSCAVEWYNHSRYMRKGRDFRCLPLLLPTLLPRHRVSSWTRSFPLSHFSYLSPLSWLGYQYPKATSNLLHWC